MLNEPPSDELRERLAAVVDRLHHLQLQYEKAHDSRCVFTYIYVMMTRRVGEGVAGARFEDPGWIVDMAEHFAERYVAAMSRYGTGQEQGHAWRATLAAVCDRRASVLEAAVFPMVAHIVHDLPYAIIDVGLTDSSGKSRQGDYDAVNDLMGRAMDTIRTSVTRRYSPGLRWLDRMERHYDLILTDYGIRMSRGLAWYNAERLSDPLLRERAAQSLERAPAVLIKQVRTPATWSIALLLWLGRWIAGLFRRWP
jgi:hypothetical protein